MDILDMISLIFLENMAWPGHMTTEILVC